MYFLVSSAHPYHPKRNVSGDSNIRRSVEAVKRENNTQVV
jgi:hypothetical protein